VEGEEFEEHEYSRTFVVVVFFFFFLFLFLLLSLLMYSRLKTNHVCTRKHPREKKDLSNPLGFMTCAPHVRKKKLVFVAVCLSAGKNEKHVAQ
jgi:hypothetical protein